MATDLTVAAGQMLATMPNYGPGDTVFEHGCDTPCVVESLEYAAGDDGPVWFAHIETPSRTVRCNAADWYSARDPRVSIQQSTPPFAVDDLVSLRDGSVLLENNKFMRSDRFRVLECSKSIHEPKPSGDWIIRLERVDCTRDVVVPISPQEFFGADAFVRTSEITDRRYVKDVKFIAGELVVVYGQF